MDTGILVTGVGEASATPDVVRAHLTIGCDRTDVSSALSAVAERATQVLDALRELGLSDPQLQTDSVQVHPRYGRNGSVVVAYRASHGLVASCPDLSTGGRLLMAAASAGGNELSIDHVTMEIADPAPLKSQARERAFTDARERAEAFAGMSGRTLGDLEFLEEHHEGRGFRGARAASVAFDAAESMPIQGGEHTIRAQITVRWGLAARADA